MVAAAAGPADRGARRRAGRRGPGLGRVLAARRRARAPALAAMPEPFEGRVAAALEPALPDDALVWLSYSMPVRDVEAFFPTSPKPLRFLAGRGANGIDGVVSSAAGAALGVGPAAFLVTGDVALIHDVGGLLAAARAGVDLTVVCVNNEGGGIFDFLPVAGAADRDALRTPHRHPARRGPGSAGPARRARAPPGRGSGRAPGGGGAAQASWRCAPTAPPTWSCTRSWCGAWPSRSRAGPASSRRGPPGPARRALARGAASGSAGPGRAAAAPRSTAAPRWRPSRSGSAPRRPPARSRTPRSRRDRWSAPMRSARRTSSRAPRTAGSCGAPSERESMIADCGR